MTTEDKALALLNDVRTERGFAPVGGLYGSALLGEALCRAIEQHEAFRQEVSDAVEVVVEVFKHEVEFPALERFIIPKPKPDPLVEVLTEISGEGGFDNFDHYAHNLRAALEARGFEIREKSK